MNILVCFDNNDYLITKINCDLEEAKEYYLEKSFTYWDALTQQEASHVAKFVLDINKPFNVKYKNNITDPYHCSFSRLLEGEEAWSCYNIELKNIVNKELMSVESGWFFKNENRVITQ